MRTLQYGYTLVELIITVGILGMLAAIALPNYMESIESSCIGVAEINLDTLALFEENYYFEAMSYHAGVRTVDGNGNVTSDTLSGPLKWRANDENQFNYSVTAGPGGITQSAVIEVSQDGCDETASKTLSQN